MNKIQQLACTSMGFASRLGLDKQLEEFPKRLKRKLRPLKTRAEIALRSLSNSRGKETQRLQRFLTKVIDRESQELGIPQEFRPDVYIFNAKKTRAEFGAAYLPETNSIIVDINSIKKGNRLSLDKVRTVLKHELKHTQQYFEAVAAGNAKDIGISYPKTLEQLALLEHRRPSLSQDRIKAFNDYHTAVDQSTQRGFNREGFELKTLAESKAKKFGYQSYQDLQNNASKKDKVLFWGALRRDFYKGARKDRVQGTLHRLYNLELARMLDSYAESDIETEARLHSGESGFYSSETQAKDKANSHRLAAQFVPSTKEQSPEELDRLIQEQGGFTASEKDAEAWLESKLAGRKVVDLGDIFAEIQKNGSE